MTDAQMSADTDDRGWDAIAIHQDDDVAVALRDLAAGTSVRIRRGGAIERVTAAAAIPLGHKLALRALAAGAGVRYFDTAPFYGHGLAEHRAGETLRGVERGRFVLSTKVGRLLRPNPTAKAEGPFAGILPFDIVPDYSYDGTLRSLADSMQRL